MTVGDRIKRARALRDKMSRPQLAALTGIPYATLAGIENGDQGSSTRLHEIADALDVNLAWLADNKGPMERARAKDSAGQGASHLARLDPETIAVTTRALHIILRRRDPKATLNLENVEDAALFAAVYAEAEGNVDELALGAVVADLVAEREARRGRQGEQAGRDDRSKTRRKAAGK